MRLRDEVIDLTGWDDLAQGAEDHGLEPLVLARFQDAGVAMPAPIVDRLRVRRMQHAHAHAVRTRVVGELARAFDAASIPFLLLKGAALAHLVYDTPLLRPMRDVDLLLRKRDVSRAHAVLERGGFTPSGIAVTPDYHHLRAMSTTVDGAMVTIELHHEVLRATPFLKPICYEDVQDGAQSLTWAGTTFHTVGREDMLWHLYAHAFAINVLRPEIRLNSIADLVHAVEKWVDALDWDRLRRQHGRLVRALPLLHHLTPLSPAVLAKLGRAPSEPRRPVAPPIAAPLRWTGALKRDVLWPAEWWFRMRYGVEKRRDWLWYRFAGHPARLLLASAGTARTRFTKRLGARAPRVVVAQDEEGKGRRHSQVRRRTQPVKTAGSVPRTSSAKPIDVAAVLLVGGLAASCADLGSTNGVRMRSPSPDGQISRQRVAGPAFSAHPQRS